MTKIREQSVDWKTIYHNANSNVWPQEPHRFTIEAAELAPIGNTTDLGSGEGYDALFLAEKGFTITAVDISKVALKGVEQAARLRNLNITTDENNVKTIKLTQPQSLLASYGVLHFLGDNFQERLEHFQDVTIDRGVHSFYLFGDNGDFHNVAHEKFWFPNTEEIKNLYDNWTIHRLEEKNVEMFIRGDHGELLHNSMIKILAQKS